MRRVHGLRIYPGHPTGAVQDAPQHAPHGRQRRSCPPVLISNHPFDLQWSYGDSNPQTSCMPSGGSTSTHVHARRSPSRRVSHGPPPSAPVAVLPCCTAPLASRIADVRSAAETIPHLRCPGCSADSHRKSGLRRPPAATKQPNARICRMSALKVSPCRLLQDQKLKTRTPRLWTLTVSAGSGPTSAGR